MIAIARIATLIGEKRKYAARLLRQRISFIESGEWELELSERPVCSTPDSKVKHIFLLLQKNSRIKRLFWPNRDAPNLRQAHASACAKARNRPGSLLAGELAGPVMSVNPDLMMVTPTPMPRHPAPVIAACPIARPVGVVWTVAHFDVDTDGVRGRGEAT